MTRGNVLAARPKAMVLVLMSVFLLGAVACESRTPQDDPTTGGEGSGSTQQVSSPSGGVGVAGQEIIGTLDPKFDAAYQITLEVPDGYGNHGGFAWLKSGLVETGVSVWVVDRVYADGCMADESRLERAPDGSVDGLATLLASQDGFRVSAPEDVAVDGFPGTYMERMLPHKTDPGNCFAAMFQVWISRGNGNRYLQHAGQRDLLWIVDVDGVPLVIDAPLDAEASEQDRAEVLGMVESIQIESR